MIARLKRMTNQIDHAIWIVIILSLIAAWAFILRPSLPRETDAELHVFRAAELGYSLRGGAFYPRWAPDFYYGYGYPIFNYYAPLTYYLANLLSLAIPGGAVFGVKMVFILGFMAGGLGVYGLVSQQAGTKAGLIGASSYLFMPYVYLVDAHLRGDLAEFFALGVGPLAFWALSTFLQRQNRRSFIWASLAVAAVILTHNLLALVYFAMLVGYSVWIVLLMPLITRTRIDLKKGASTLLVLGLGLALSAFFWLPVGLESDAVQLSNLIGPGHFDYRNHFLSLKELFSPSIPLDLGAVNPAFRFNLGLAQWLLGLAGLAGLVILLRSGKKQPLAATLFWPVSLLVFLALMLPLSLVLWDAIPMMAFLQFPWRLLGPAALALAVLGGHAAQLLDLIPEREGKHVLAGLVIAPLLLTLPVFVVPGWGEFGPTDRLAMLEFELNGLALGTTSTGDFVPAGVDVVPGPTPDMVDAYYQGTVPDRVNWHTLPEGAAVELLNQRPTASRYAVHSSEDFVLRLYLFMFDGWRATIDGKPAAIQIAKPEGFVTVPVPAGDHTVHIWLGQTLPRTLAALISLGGLVGLWWLARGYPKATGQPRQGAAVDLRPVIAGAAAFVFVAGIGAQFNLFQPRSEGIAAQPAQHDLHAYLAGGIDLIGYDLPLSTARPEDSVPVTLYWKAREPAYGNYQVFVHLTTLPQHTWGQSDKLNPGDYPTSRWPLDRYVRDPHSLTISPGTPPGEYQVRFGLWDRTTGTRQLILEADGTVLGDSLVLPEPITVLPAEKQPAITELDLDTVLDQDAAPGLVLLGYQREPAGPFTDGVGYLKLALYWRAGESPLPDYVIALRIVDEAGEVITSTEGRPVDGRYPTSEWETGQIVRDLHSFWIDESIPAGTYAVEIGIRQAGDDRPADWQPIMMFERGDPGS